MIQRLDASHPPSEPSERDQVFAYHPVTGKLHSASPAYPWFEDSMQRQGYRIVRVPEAEWRASQGRICPRPTVEHPAPDAVLASPPPPQVSSTPDLPAVGDWVETKLLGLMQITHAVTLPDEGVTLPVGVGRRGTGLIRSGDWVLAAPPVAAPPTLELEPEPPPPPSVSLSTHQPTLFDLMEVSP